MTGAPAEWVLPQEGDPGPVSCPSGPGVIRFWKWITVERASTRPHPHPRLRHSTEGVEMSPRVNQSAPVGPHQHVAPITSPDRIQANSRWGRWSTANRVR